MTATPRRTRTHPRPSAPHRTLSLVASEPAVLTVQITVRGTDAASALKPLVEAVRAMEHAEVIVDVPQPAPERRLEQRDATTDLATRASLRIVTEQHVAFLDGCPLSLPRREYDLLLFLARHPRRVFTRPHLLRAVWGYEFDGGGRTVDVHIRRLRQKLGERGPSIVTVRGVGYRLDDPERVEVIECPHEDT